MLPSQDLATRVAAFTRYARFLANTFDVEIVLDGTHAHTDGRTITLPALATLRPMELELLYAVLLHEVGHVRYSAFDEALFSRLTTEAVALLANAIEDARVENALLKEFKGAEAIFRRLYGDFARRRRLMRRVFGEALAQANPWAGVALAVHRRLLRLDGQAPLGRLLSRDAAAAVRHLVRGQDLHTLLDRATLRSTADSVALAETIYQRLQHAVPDETARLRFDKRAKAIHGAATMLKQGLGPSIAAGRDALEAQLAAVRMQQQALRQLRQEQAPAIRAATERLAGSHQTQRAHQSVRAAEAGATAAAAARDAAAQAVAASTAAVASPDELRTQQGAALAERRATRRAALEERRATAQAALDAARTDKQREKAADRIAKADERLRALDAQHDASTRSLDQKAADRLAERKAAMQAAAEALVHATTREKDARRELANAVKRATRVLGYDPTTLGVEERAVREAAAGDAIQQAEEALKPIREAEQRALAAIADAEQSAARADLDLGRAITKELRTLEDRCAAAGAPGMVLPGFEPTAGWPGIDAAQQDFDRQASDETGEYCANGAGLGSGGRNLSVFVDRAAAALAALDLGALFAREAMPSRLPAMNDHPVEQANGHETHLGRTSLPAATYAALTTQFDTVRPAPRSGTGRALEQIRAAHAPTLARLKQVARARLRVGKKDRFRGAQPEGDLDTRSLWRLATRSSEDYFETRVSVPNNPVAATILVDLSGSHDTPLTQQGARLRELTLLLSDALDAAHVRHEILGVHAPIAPELRALPAAPRYTRRIHRLDTIIFRSFSDRSNAGVEGLAVQASDNADGEHLRLAMQRLRRTPAKGRLLFVITDGKPYLSDGSPHALAALDADLAAAIRECEANRVEIFALGFGPGPEAFYGDRYTAVPDYEDLVRFIDRKLGAEARARIARAMAGPRAAGGALSAGGR